MKNRLIAFLMVIICGMTLPGCANKNAGINSNAENTNSQSEIDDSEGNEHDSENRIQIGRVNIPSMEQVHQMLDDFTNWAGLQYMYDPTNDYGSLDNDSAIEMAAMSIAQTTENPVYEGDWKITIKFSEMDEQMQNMFGKTFNLSTYEKGYTDDVEVETDKVHVSSGDWGLLIPMYSIQKVLSNDDGTFTIIVRYLTKDLEKNEVAYGYEYNVNYTCIVDETSKYGFVIKNMEAKRTGSLPERFDPLSVAGTYKHEGVQNVNGDDETFTEWIVLGKDGTGYWSSKEDTKISVTRHNVIVGQDVEVPYTYYDGVFTLYMENDDTKGVYQVNYVKTDEEAPAYGSERGDR